MFSKNPNINLEQSILAQNRVPVLVKDDQWLKLFGNTVDKSINNARKKLETLIEKEKVAKKTLIEKKKEKKKIMSKIIMLSDEINNNSYKDETELLGQYQQEIFEINDEIDRLMFELETLPKEIRKANLILLEATVRLAYKQLTEWENSIEPFNVEIDKLRNKLRELIEKKNDYEEKINTTYRFLHGILGSKEIEKLDKDILE